MPFRRTASRPVTGKPSRVLLLVSALCTAVGCSAGPVEQVGAGSATSGAAPASSSVHPSATDHPTSASSGPNAGPATTDPELTGAPATVAPAGGLDSTAAALPAAEPAAAAAAAPAPALAPTPTPTPAPAPAPAPAPTGSVAPIDDALAARMSSSWRPGCPVPLADLRLLTVPYIGMDGAPAVGQLVVAASVAEPVLGVFAELYRQGYPIASMRLVDDFGGDDDASMAADNTSAFKCRPVTGGGGFSEHSSGTAIDLNPVENPYVRSGVVSPPAGAQFVTRPAAPGVIQADGPVVAAFAAIGWSWGGAWQDPVDFQHFSLSGR